MHSARASACEPQPFVQTGRRRTWCLYLHSVHSRRSEIFFVVFAWRGSRAHVSHVVPRARSQEPTNIITTAADHRTKTQPEGAFTLKTGPSRTEQSARAPSCGRRAWSDHHNRTASGRNVSYLCFSDDSTGARFRAIPDSGR